MTTTQQKIEALENLEEVFAELRVLPYDDADVIIVQVIKQARHLLNATTIHTTKKGSKNMSYTVTNFRTKKALKEALASGAELECYQPGLGPDLEHFTGRVSLEGPHYPKAHTWYASAELVDGKIVKVS